MKLIKKGKAMLKVEQEQYYKIPENEDAFLEEDSRYIRKFFSNVAQRANAMPDQVDDPKYKKAYHRFIENKFLLDDLDLLQDRVSSGLHDQCVQTEKTLESIKDMTEPAGLIANPSVIKKSLEDVIKDICEQRSTLNKMFVWIKTA